MRGVPTVVTATPGQNGMVVRYGKDFDPNGMETTAFATWVSVSPAYGAANAAKLSGAGVVAMTAAANTSVAALSAANRDLINNTLPGGLVVLVSPYEVRVPCLGTGVATLAAAFNTVLGTAANVSVLS